MSKEIENLIKKEEFDYNISKNGYYAILAVAYGIFIAAVTSSIIILWYIAMFMGFLIIVTKFFVLKPHEKKILSLYDKLCKNKEENKK
jgi:hypothetical protein|tara:strand:+ start:120 stop:383 length:264 start_codon:yes stop_codon:yes gene_type:complete